MRRLGMYAVVGRVANFPFWGAMRGAGLARVEMGSALDKWWRHNMGLCQIKCMGEGRGVNSRRGMGREGVGLGVWRIFIKKGKKVVVKVVKVSESCGR